MMRATLRSLPGMLDAEMITISPLPTLSRWEALAMRNRPLMGSPWEPVVMTHTWSSRYFFSLSTLTTLSSGRFKYPSSRAMAEMFSTLLPWKQITRPLAMARSAICWIL